MINDGQKFTRKTFKPETRMDDGPPISPPHDEPPHRPNGLAKNGALNDAVDPYNFWPEHGVPMLPTGLLPKRIETFARAAAIAVGADEGGFAMAALATCAASIGDAIQVRVTPFSDWLEAARIWVALVGLPSSKKTPILNTTCKQLKREDQRRWGIYAKQMAAWKALPKAERSMSPEPVNERLIIGDTTVEAAQEAFRSTSKGLFGLYDEMGGWFGSMDRYGSASRSSSSDRAFMLQAYNGGPYRVDRIERGQAYLENISLTILGGIQPDLIRKVTGSPDDDGLVQRLTPIRLRSGRVAGHDLQAALDMEDFAVLVPQLLGLQPPGSGEHLKFDAGAQKIQREFSSENGLLVQGFERFNQKFSTALGKQDGLFARLCVIWHAVENANGDINVPAIISESVAQRVAAFMTQFTRPHLFDFYEMVLEQPEEQERLTAIAGYILSKKLTTIANRQVQAAVRSARKLTSKDITPVFEQLEAMGWLVKGAPLSNRSAADLERQPASTRFICGPRSERNRKKGAIS